MLAENAIFFGPSLGPPAFASASPRQATRPRLGPQKSIFSAHFSMAGILILETQNIYLFHDFMFKEPFFCSYTFILFFVGLGVMLNTILIFGNSFVDT